LPGIEQIRIVHSHGAQVGVQIGTADAAKRAIDEGCDFIICQGVEAGGHVQSSIPLDVLLAAVLEMTAEVPIVAAGGIVDAADVSRVLAAGADGVMLGTRFVATPESRAHPDYRNAIVAAAAGDTALTRCFDGGWPDALHRVLRNPTLQRWEDDGRPTAGKRTGEHDVVAKSARGHEILRYDDTPPANDMTGDVLACPLYAGTGVSRIRSILPAAEVVRTLGRAWQVPQEM
jgi:NAD(P)H-dependent flavin oxidoreductase YrpB (nitropropane dioxygenase family)